MTPLKLQYIFFRNLFKTKPKYILFKVKGSSLFSPIQKFHSNNYHKCKNLVSNAIDNNDEDFKQSASLYIHWPYCAKRCTYCDFNKYVQFNIDFKRITECLVTETKTLLNLSGVRKITSVYFGGGTPSLAKPDTVQKIIEAIKSTVHFPEHTEVTLEANPTALEASKLLEFKNAGINRLSVGVQSLRDDDLRLLGRNHTAAEAIACTKEAIALFQGCVSVDLIFGRHKQTLIDWLAELSEVLEFCDDHLSLYQLTVKKGTPLYKQVLSNQVTLPDSDILANMYEACVELLEKKSFVRYEISNFARNGAESVHNKSYWEGRQYIGIGPGAHGRFICKNSLESKKPVYREARIQTLEPRQWMSDVESFGHGTRKRVPLSLQDMVEEALVMGLRTRQGINCSLWKERTDLDLIEIFSQSRKFEELVQQNFISFSENWLKATKRGMNVVDSILPDLLNSIQEYCVIQNNKKTQHNK